jgi:hypothetical protein
MANFRVIWVKVVAPEKLLDLNTFSKNTLMLILLFTLSQNNLCVDMAICDIQKYLCWFDQLNVDLNLKPTPLSLPPLMFSPSLPNPQYLVLSFCTLCLIPLYILPVLIPHKKRMIIEYDYHCLIDNKSLRTHLLFHLALKYNILLWLLRLVYSVA